MAHDGSTTKKILNNTNKYVSFKTISFVIFITIVLFISYGSKNIYKTKTDEYKNRVYDKINQKVLDNYKVMLDEKLATSTLISSSLSKNNNIKKALILNNTNFVDMNKLLDEMRITKEYADIQAEIINSEGISFKRSWMDLAGDDMIQNDPQLAHLIKYPRVERNIEATKYGMKLTNKIPIYERDKFLGLFGVNLNFDALVDVFVKDEFDSVILLNMLDSRKIIHELSYSKRFIGEYYVVNSNANTYLLKVLKQNGVKQFYDNWDSSFIINKESNHLVSKFIIKDSRNLPIAKIIIFKSIDEIIFEDLDFFQNTHIIVTILLIMLVAFFINYWMLRLSTKEITKYNDELVIENNELQIKANELDYKEKELDNLFDNQPNVMFMHNTKAIEKVNRRFIKGFFRRFKTYEGFREKHACVSELFETYDGDNYICQQIIDGKYWIDFILDDPRKLYKAIISVDGDQHHFIIKLNEMEFNKKSSERLVIVALVDVTQDIVDNILCLEELKEEKLKHSTQTDKIEEIKQIEQKTEKVIEKKVENKIKDIKKPKTIAITPTIAPKKTNTKNKNKNKFDAYGLIQKSLSTVLEDTIMQDVSSANVTAKALELSVLKDKNILQFDNKFIIVNKKDPLQWTLMIPIQSISKLFNIMIGANDAEVTNDIDDDLKELSQAFVDSMADIILKNTNNKVKIQSAPVKIKNNEKLNSLGGKLFDLGFSIDNEKLPIFIMIENSKR